MTSVDDLFKKPGLPSGGSLKRKLEVPDADAAYKASKLSNASSPNGRATNGATVEDEEEDDDMEAGPELPPEDDEGDDEEGRFFGGGISKDTTDALDYLDKQDEDTEYTEEKIDSAWLKRLTTSFERKVNKNAELRGKHEGDAQKFMQSEADLDEEIKSWSLLSSQPTLYPEFASTTAPTSIVNLLSHENTDIVIASIQILSELLDEDVEAEPSSWDALVTVLLDADLLALLMSNLTRLDESDPADRQGVYLILSIIESLASNTPVAEQIATEQLLEWLCRRIEQPEGQCSENKQYAAEVLQVLLQSSSVIRERLAVEVEGVDLFLQLLSVYRKRDPERDSFEEEFAENVFDALTCVCDERSGKEKFVEAEGVELCLIMVKEGEFSRSRALRLLDHAAAGVVGGEVVGVCEKLIEAGGLKIVFGGLLRKKRKIDGATVEHVVGLLASLLRHLPGGEDGRIRLMNKFSESEFEKTERLVGLREEYMRRLQSADAESEVQVEFVKRSIDVSLAWLAAEDKAIREKILGQVKRDALVSSLQEQVEDLDPDTAGDDDTREMLETLIGFL